MNNIERFREERGWSRPELGRRMGTSGQQIERLEKGQRSLRQDWIDKAAKAFGVLPSDIISPDVDPSTLLLGEDDDHDEESVEIDSIDLGYGMGGTYLDAPDGALEVERLRFTRTFLRNFTPTSPEHLFVATGHGDSMIPTIQDADIVLIDRSDRTPKMRDKFWAMSVGGIGMIKRLRPNADGTMTILSDNPTVPDDVATDGELFIHGRVVAIVRKV